MASTTVVESIKAKVEEVSKKGREGSYKVKVVKANGKEWTVSKDDKDSVKVGQEYNFKLSKSEYNDKLYYWANLLKSEEAPEDGESQDEFKSKVFKWLAALDTDQKKKVIVYLLERI